MTLHLRFCMPDLANIFSEPTQVGTGSRARLGTIGLTRRVCGVQRTGSMRKCGIRSRMRALRGSTQTSVRSGSLSMQVGNALRQQQVEPGLRRQQVTLGVLRTPGEEPEARTRPQLVAVWMR